MKLLFFILIVCSQSVMAYTRGGACNSSICNLTGFLVVAAILFFLFLSIFGDVKNKGFVKGIVENSFLLPIAVIVVGFVSVIWVIAQAYKYDEDLAFIIMGGIFIYLIYLGSKGGNGKSST